MIFMDKMTVTGDAFHFLQITVWCVIHHYSKHTVAGNMIKPPLATVLNQ